MSILEVLESQRSGLDSGLGRESHELRAAERRLLLLSYELPMASASEMAVIGDLGLKNVYRLLQELRRRGLVDCRSLGSVSRRTRRWWLTAAGLAALGVSWRNRHQVWSRTAFLQRLTVVESFYHCAGWLKMFGDFQSFTWREGRGIDAVAAYRKGWVCLCWSGAWQSAKVVERRVVQVMNNLRDSAGLSGIVAPSLYVWVVSDAWQGEVVRRAMAQMASLNAVGIWVAGDAEPQGLVQPQESVGQLAVGGRRPVAVRDESGDWEGRVADSVWSSEYGRACGVALDAVAEWPGLRFRLLEAVLVKGGVNSAHGKVISHLEERGYVGRVGRGVGSRFLPKPKGVYLMSQRDRVRYETPSERVEELFLAQSPRLRRHEDGVMDLAAEFYRGGLACAAGWRLADNLYGRGQLRPDLMVRLERGPWGGGWHYGEYERSARGQRRVLSKLRNYASSLRRDRCPVMVVCYDRVAEEVFQSVARELGLARQLTTTIERLARCGAVGNAECWQDTQGVGQYVA